MPSVIRAHFSQLVDHCVSISMPLITLNIDHAHPKMLVSTFECQVS
jgi:hypothetical protein